MADIDIKRSPYTNEILKTPLKQLSFGANETLKSFTVQANGLLTRIIFNLPDFTNSPDATLTIENGDGTVIYSSGAKAENQLLNIACDVPLTGVNTVNVTLSAVPGGSGGNVEVTMYVI